MAGCWSRALRLCVHSPRDGQTLTRHVLPWPSTRSACIISSRGVLRMADRARGSVAVAAIMVWPRAGCEPERCMGRPLPVRPSATPALTRCSPRIPCIYLKLNRGEPNPTRRARPLASHAAPDRTSRQSATRGSIRKRPRNRF
jgi:hypothetical protein